MSNTASLSKKASPFQVAVFLVPLLFALVLIYFGVTEYVVGRADSGSFWLTLGMVTLVFSVYWIYQTRKRILKLMSVEMQPLSTTLQCRKCGLKNVREFQRGDFVFKQTDQACPKDNEKMMISAIYREVKEKEKGREEANP